MYLIDRSSREHVIWLEDSELVVPCLGRVIQDEDR